MKKEFYKKNILNIVIFGVTGDLYRNKLAHALFSLFKKGLLPKEFNIIGFGRRMMTNDDFISSNRDNILSKNIENKDKIEEFLTHLKYFKGDLENEKSFEMLKEYLLSLDKNKKSNTLFYLAISPSLYKIVLSFIFKTGLSLQGEGNKYWSRILIEKPFGGNLKEAQDLSKFLEKSFSQEQIFHIDHYLMKENLRNFLNFRFLNKNFENLLNSKNIEKIKIVFREKGVVGTRGFFYDKLGALCDVGQNHMLQILTFITMQTNIKNDFKQMQKNRLNLLKNIVLFPLNKYKIMRGQYEGYKNEVQVDPNSSTETFFNLILKIQNPKWKNVLFELESGKALVKSEVYVEFYMKNPNIKFKFDIANNISKKDAYESVFYEAFLGNHTFFVNIKEIIIEWKIIDKIMTLWKRVPLFFYPQGFNPENIR